jgi:hypothetical protein
VHLILGTATERHPQRRSPFGRIPGISLFSTNQQLVRSLHPDNLDLLEAPGSTVECVIVSRCDMPTEASALFALGSAVTKQSWKLFWVIHIVWKDGIAERRGIGQVLSSALETATDPKPEVKVVLLG